MKNRLSAIRQSPAYVGLVLFVSALVIYFVIQFIGDPAGFLTAKTYKNFASLFKNYTPLILVTMGQALLMLLGIIDMTIPFRCAERHKAA